MVSRREARVGLAVLAIAVAACGGGDDGSSEVAAATSTTSEQASGGGSGSGGAPIGGGSFAGDEEVAFDPPFVFSPSADDYSSGIDIASVHGGAPISRLGDGIRRVDVLRYSESEGLWAILEADDDLALVVKLDADALVAGDAFDSRPDEDYLLASAPVPYASELVLDGGSVYVLTTEVVQPNNVVRLDAASGVETGRASFVNASGHGPIDELRGSGQLAVGAGGIWVATDQAGIYRIDLATLEVTQIPNPTTEGRIYGPESAPVTVGLTEHERITVVDDVVYAWGSSMFSEEADGQQLDGVVLTRYDAAGQVLEPTALLSDDGWERRGGYGGDLWTADQHVLLRGGEDDPLLVVDLASGSVQVVDALEPADIGGVVIADEEVYLFEDTGDTGTFHHLDVASGELRDATPLDDGSLGSFEVATTSTATSVA